MDAAVTVLLVDGDTDLLDLLAYVLAREGYRVVTATDGEQALARWRAEQPDLVVLEANLPQVDGFEVCHHICRESATPVILLTTRSDPASVLRGLQAGAEDYVTKPFSYKHLTARIGALLRHEWSRTNEAGAPAAI